MHFFGCRWISSNEQRQQKQNQVGSPSSGGGVGDEVLEDNPITSSVECYACTRVGAPVFHSTSCDKANQPQWEACAGTSLIPISSRTDLKKGLSAAARSSSHQQLLNGPFGRVLDPRSKRVQRWNRAFLLARGMALAVDPLFFYALSIGRGGTPCLYMDGGLAAIVTVLRTCVDAVHLCHLWLQFRLAYVSRESLVVGCGKLVWDARAVASHYLRSLKGFWFDAFVILPVPQVKSRLSALSLVSLCVAVIFFFFYRMALLT